MDELLKQMVLLVSHCKFTPEQKSKNIIVRLVESPEKILKSLKEANSATNDFQKGRAHRNKDKPREGGHYQKDGGYNKGGDRKGHYNDRGDNRKNFRDERPADDGWRAEEDEMV